MTVYDAIVKKVPITKGWSEDNKFCVTTTDGSKYLLRVSPMSHYDNRKELYAIQELVAASNIPMCKPVEFGTCEDGVYSIQSWIEGDDLEAALPLLSETEQYVLGLKAGEILRKIHNIPVPETEIDGIGAVERILQDYQEHGQHFEGDDKVIAYISHNLHHLEDRPQCFLFSDYNVKNMMFENGELRIIDFERFEIGDPWEEFKNIVWSAYASPHFATGQIRGYFGGEPPMYFFRLLSVYIPCLLLSLLSSWAVSSEFGRVVSLKLSQDVLKWFGNMNNLLPTWYLGSFEVWDVYDKERNKTGRLHERGKPMTPGDYHIIVHVWKYNAKGEWLIDKRTPRYGRSDLDGKWETTGGCAVTGDDSLNAALRESKEELGIDLHPQRGILFSSTDQRWEDGHTAFIDVWVFECNEMIENVVPDEREVSEVMWASADTIRTMINAGEFLDYSYFEEMVREWRAAKCVTNTV